MSSTRLPGVGGEPLAPADGPVIPQGAIAIEEESVWSKFVDLLKEIVSLGQWDTRWFNHTIDERKWQNEGIRLARLPEASALRTYWGKAASTAGDDGAEANMQQVIFAQLQADYPDVPREELQRISHQLARGIAIELSLPPSPTSTDAPSASLTGAALLSAASPPPTPVATSIDAARYRQLAKRLQAATESRVNGWDVFGLMFTAGASTGISRGRRMDVVQPEEAEQLLAGASEAADAALAKRQLEANSPTVGSRSVAELAARIHATHRLPPADRRALAVALRIEIEVAGVDFLAADGSRDPATLRLVQDFIDRELSPPARPASQADTAVGAVLAYGDMVHNRIRLAFRDVQGAVAQGTALRPDDVSLQPKAVRGLAQALVQLPVELQDSVRERLRTEVRAQGGWPKGYEQVPQLTALKELIGG